MALITITINDPSPAFDKKSAEIAYIRRVLQDIEMEIGRGNGTVLSGTVVGQKADGTTNYAKGSWTYAPVATKP